MALSTRIYTACNQINLLKYYNKKEGNRLICEMCGGSEAESLQDTLLSDGETHWYFCPSCGFSGTSTEYIAKTEQKPVSGILQELQMLPNDIEAYQRHLTKEKLIREKFMAAEHYQRNSNLQLADIYDLDQYPPAQTFRQSPRTGIEGWFQKIKGNCTSSARIFKGKWTSIVAVPLYDMPLHMSGLLFINGHELGEHKYAVKRLGPKSATGFLFDPGYFGNRHIGNTEAPIVLSGDWKLTLRLQAAAYKQENKYPPLLGWFPEYPYHWAYLRNSQKIFWSHALDIENLRAACIQNAHVSNAYYNEKGYFVHPGLLAGAVIRSVISGAVHWKKALEQFIDRYPERINELQLPESVLNDFSHTAAASAVTKIHDQIAAADSITYIDGHRILSDKYGWHKVSRHSAKELLSNVKCTIDKVIHIVSGSPVIQGNIEIGGITYPFSENEYAFYEDPVKCIKKVCADHADTNFLRLHVNKEKYLRMIQAMSSPKIIHKQEGYGWSDKESSLLLPNITVSAGMIFDTEMNFEKFPFYKLRHTKIGGMTPADTAVLSNFKEETPYIFSIFAAVVPMLFAYAYKMPPPQTVICGGDFSLIRQIFTMLGLPVFSVKDYKGIEEYTDVHRCPYLVRMRGTSQYAVQHDWADMVGFHSPAFVWCPLAGALARLSYGKANLLLMSGEKFYRWFDGKLPDVFLKCFVEIIKHFSSYVLNPKVLSCDWNNDIIDETTSLIDDMFDVNIKHRSLFPSYDNQADCFCDYVSLLRKNESCFTDNKIAVGVLSSCYRKHIGKFDISAILHHLSEANILEEYNADSHEIVLDRQALDRSEKRLEKFYGPFLR